MRLRALLFIVLLGGMAFGQGVSFQGPKIESQVPQPIAGLTISVCLATSTGTPCTPTVSVFSDSALSVPILSLTTDGDGMFPTFFISPGQYQWCASDPTQGRISPYCTKFTAPAGSGSSPTFNNLTVTGNLFEGGSIFAIGSCAAPPYSFQTQSNAGLCLAGVGTVGLSAGGVAQLTATSTGVNIPGTLGVTGNVTGGSIEGTIEADQKCTSAGVYDQSCINNAFAAAIPLQKIHVAAHTYNLTGSGTDIIHQTSPYKIECDPAAILLVAASVPNSTDIWHAVASASNPTGWRWNGCSIAYTNGASKTITAASNATPIVLTSTAHGLVTGNVVQCSGIAGNTHGNGTWVIINTGANTFSLTGSVGNAAYTSGGTCSIVPGGYGLHLDVTNGNIISDFRIEEMNVGQSGKSGIYLDNTGGSQDGIFTGLILHNTVKGGFKFDNLGDSVNFQNNITTGGFDAFNGSILSAAAAIGAHHVTFTKNNMTNQGCAVKITNGSFMQFTSNNSEPTAGLSQGGPDTTNCSNNATFDLDCTTTSPCYGVHLLDNTQAPSPDAAGPQNAFRCNWCVGAIWENNHPELAVGGQKAYVTTNNAKNVQVYIPVQENGATCSTLMTIGSASTQVFFQNNTTGGAVWEIGCVGGISNSLFLREGTAQAFDIFAIFQNGGTPIVEVFPTTHGVAIGGGGDNGNALQVTGSSTFSNNVAFSGILTKYNGVSLVGNGIPSAVAKVDNASTNATTGTQTLFACTAAPVRLSWNAKVVTVGSVSSTLGPLTIVYTDADGVAQTITAPASGPGGTIATTSTTNVTTSVLLGMPLLLNCKSGTNVTYNMGYTSNGAGTMFYNLHLFLEQL